MKEPVQNIIIYLKASGERGYIKNLPQDGRRAFRPISLDRRQLGLVREEGQIVDHGNMNERLVIDGNKEYVQEWSCKKMCKKKTLCISVTGFAMRAFF